MKKAYSPFFSTLLLLIMSWTTLSGNWQFGYADAEEEIEWSEEWAPEEKEDSSEDTFEWSGSDGDEEVGKKTPSSGSNGAVSSPLYWTFGSSVATAGLDDLYLAVSISFNQVQRERLCTPRQPLFILYCTYTSSLPILA